MLRVTSRFEWSACARTQGTRTLYQLVIIRSYSHSCSLLKQSIGPLRSPGKFPRPFVRPSKNSPSSRKSTLQRASKVSFLCKTASAAEALSWLSSLFNLTQLMRQLLLRQNLNLRHHHPPKYHVFISYLSLPPFLVNLLHTWCLSFSPFCSGVCLRQRFQASVQRTRGKATLI